LAGFRPIHRGKYGVQGIDMAEKITVQPFLKNDSSPVNPSPEGAPEAKSPELLPGFWVRLLALVVDVILLIVVCKWILKTGYTSLYPLGWKCQGIGIALTWLYFFLGASSLTGGRTAGKALLRIRTLSLQGQPLSPARAALRAFAMLLLVHIVATTIGSSLRMLAIALFGREVAIYIGIAIPSPNLGVILGIDIIHIIALAFALANAAFCGLHPNKRALQDLVSGSVVIREGLVSEGIEAAISCGEFYPAKMKLTVVCSVVIAIIILGQGTLGLWRNIKQMRKDLIPTKESMESFPVPGFEFYGMYGPSEEYAKQFDGLVEKNKADLKDFKEGKYKGKNKPKPIPQDYMKYAPDGRKFVMVIRISEDISSETLKLDPRIMDIEKWAVEKANTLSPQYFTDKAGHPLPYKSVQLEFINLLPLYLWTKSEPVWTDLIPVTGHDAPAPLAKETSSSTDTQTVVNGAEDAPTSGTR
jgi:uncharacterized RDD family membrane protein YckC